MSTKYNVYYSTSANGPWTLANNTPLDQDPSGSNSYTVTGLDSNQRYYISIVGGELDSLTGDFLPMHDQPIGPRANGAATVGAAPIPTYSAKTFLPKSDGTITLGQQFEITAPVSIFSLFDPASINGVDNLDASLTINGTAVTPDFRYKLGDADGTDIDGWTYGETLTLQAGTAPTYNDGSPLFGDNDDSAKFNSGGFYQASNNSFGEVGTDDIVFEAIFKWDATTNASLVCNGVSGLAGWLAFTDSGCMKFFMSDTVDYEFLSSDSLTDGAWYHMMAFINRDEASTSGSRMYINGLESGSGTDFSAVGDPTAAAPLQLGGMTSLGSWNQNIAYVALWTSADLHQAGAAGPTEWEGIALERFDKLTGFYADCDGTPVTSTRERDSAAYLDKVEGSTRKMYLVGENWLRYVSREDSEGTTIKGYFCEGEVETLAQTSEDFTSWSDWNGVTTADQTTAPNGEDTADVFHEDTALDSHGIVQILTPSDISEGDVVVMSCFLKAADRDYVALIFSAGTSAWDESYLTAFNLATGTVIAGGNTEDAGIEDWDNGWYRCWIKHTADQTDALSGAIAVTESDGSITFTGLDQDSCYLWGLMVEIDVEYPSSYMPNPGTSGITREADVLAYVGDDGSITNNQQGRWTFDFLKENGMYTPLYGDYLLSIVDGGDAVNDRLGVGVYTNKAFGTAAADSTTQEIAIGTTTVLDTVHSLRFSYQVPYARLLIDGVVESDVAMNYIPDDLDEIYIGLAFDGATGPTNGVIANIKIYDGP